MVVQKGERGYTHARRLKLGLISLIGFILVVGIITAGIIISGSTKNLLTVIGVALFLPTAKFFVQFAIIPASNKCPKEEYDEIQNSIKPLNLYCELMITAKEKRFPILYLIVDKDENIVAYTKDTKADTQSFEKGVVNFLNYYQLNAKVKLFTDIHQFKKRVRQLAEKNLELTEEQISHIEFVFQKLSIMSV